MAYSKIGVVNMALGRIGQPKISSLTESSTPAEQAALVYDFIRDEVLEADNWVFAKTRVALAQNDTEPVEGFNYAYTLPADFLRVFRANAEDPVVYPTGLASNTAVFGELRVQNSTYNYLIETLADGTLCLFTDYDNSSVDLILQYIRREENVARYSASFINALAFRLAAELAPVLTESMKKVELMTTLYVKALKQAKGVTKSGDRVADETGNTDWQDAGR